MGGGGVRTGGRGAWVGGRGWVGGVSAWGRGWRRRAGRLCQVSAKAGGCAGSRARWWSRASCVEGRIRSPGVGGESGGGVEEPVRKVAGSALASSPWKPMSCAQAMRVGGDE